MSSSSLRFRASSTKYREFHSIFFPLAPHFIFLQMESGIPYDCAFSWIISFYETYYLFSASMVRYEFPRYSESVLLLPQAGILKGITLNAPVLIASAVFLNKVSWAAMILASGGLAYVKISCFEMILLTSNIGIQLDYVVRYVKKKNSP